MSAVPEHGDDCWVSIRTSKAHPLVACRWRPHSPAQRSYEVKLEGPINRRIPGAASLPPEPISCIRLAECYVLLQHAIVRHHAQLLALMTGV